MTGLEPAASALTGQRSNQLSYTPTSRMLCHYTRPSQALSTPATATSAAILTRRARAGRLLFIPRPKQFLALRTVTPPMNDRVQCGLAACRFNILMPPAVATNPAFESWQAWVQSLIKIRQSPEGAGRKAALFASVT